MNGDIDEEKSDEDKDSGDDEDLSGNANNNNADSTLTVGGGGGDKISDVVLMAAEGLLLGNKSGSISKMIEASRKSTGSNPGSLNNSGIKPDHHCYIFSTNELFL